MGPAPYIDQDTAYGALLGNLINPPEDQAQQRPPAPAPPDPRFAVPAGQPPNPVLRVRPPAPSPTPVAPPQPAMPSGVTPSGNAGAAPQPKPVPSFYQQAQEGSLEALNRSSQAASQLQSLPDPTTANAPLEQRRTALATPIPYRDPQTGKVLTSATDPLTGQNIDPSQLYKPGVGTRILRGIRSGVIGLATGGIPGAVVGAVEPQDIRGGKAYGAPNRAYETAEQQRQAQIPIIDRQEAQNSANYKAGSERLKDIGTETRGVATGYGKVASDATSAQNADQRVAYEGQIADLRQQLADQGGVPNNYEQAAIASKLDPDPNKRAAYAAAAREIAATEVKKFQYANRTIPGADDPRRLAIIDAATAQVDKLNTWEYDADANGGAGGFYDPANPNKVYSSAEFTALKNVVATKLDKDLTAKKMRPLGVRFNVKDTTPGAAAQPATAPAAPSSTAQTAPKSAAEVQQGQVYKGYKYLGGDRTQQTSWQKVESPGTVQKKTP